MSEKPNPEYEAYEKEKNKIEQKYIDISYHHIREMVKLGKSTITPMEARLQLADAMTKALPLPHFQKLTASMRRVQVLCGRALSRRCVRRSAAGLGSVRGQSWRRC